MFTAVPGVQERMVVAFCVSGMMFTERLVAVHSLTVREMPSRATEPLGMTKGACSLGKERV